jgi:hypothetical protein
MMRRWQRGERQGNARPRCRDGGVSGKRVAAAVRLRAQARVIGISARTAAGFAAEIGIVVGLSSRHGARRRC